MAIFEGSPKKYALVDYFQAEIAAESEEERREVLTGILKDVLSRKENRGIEAVSGLDARDVMLREISVPYTKDDMIARTIRFEAESYLHSKAIEDVVIEYFKCSETESHSRLMICAVDKKLMGRHLDELKEVEVDPIAVEMDATAFASAFANTPLYSGEQNVLLLEIERDCSRMVFLEKDRVTKIRSVWGRSVGIERSDRLLESVEGDSDDGADDDPVLAPAEPVAPSSIPPSSSSSPLDSSIESRFRDIERSLSDLDRTDDEAAATADLPIAVVSDDEYARLTGSLPDPEPAAALGAATEDSGVATAGFDAPGLDAEAEAESGGTTTALAIAREGDPLERLFIEIERTFAAYVLANPVDLVVVTGSCVEELDAVQRIADRFEVDVVPFDIGDSFPIQWDGDPAELNRTGAVACGLGLRALGKGLTEFDLRQDEFKFERRFEKLMPSLALLAILCAGFTFLWAYNNHLEHQSVRKELEAVKSRSNAVFKEFFGKAPKNPTKVMVDVRNGLKKLAGPGGEGGGKSKKTKYYIDAIEMFEDLVNRVKSTNPRVYPTWQSFDFKTEVGKVKSKAVLIVKSGEEEARVIRALSGSKLFDATTSTKTLKGGEQAELTIDLALKRKVVAERGSKVDKRK